MHDSKLFLTYRTFTSKELTSWSIFVRSPFFNKDLHVISLVELINRYFPDLHSPKLKMPEVYKYVYGAAAYNENRLRKLMSKTLDLIKAFWQHSYLKEDINTQNAYDLKAYKERGINNRYKKEIFRQISRLEQKGAKETHDYLQLSKLYEDVYQDQKLLMIKDPDQYIVLATDTYVEYQQIQNMIYLLSWIDKTKVINIPIPISIEQATATTPIYSTPSTILLQFKEILNEPNLQLTKSFHECFNNLRNCHKELGPNLTYYLVRLLLNYLTRLERLNIEIADIEKEVIQWSLDNNYFLHNGILSNTLFTNIGIQYYRNGEFEKAQKFIAHSKAYLPKRTANEYVLFLRALGSFYLNKYDESLDILNNFYSGHYDQLELLRRQCIVYCLLEKGLESKDTMPILNSQLASFSKYLKYNKQLTTAKKTSFMVFIKFAWKLVRLLNSHSINSSRITRLTNELSEESTLGLYSVNWIGKYLEKMRKYHT